MPCKGLNFSVAVTSRPVDTGLASNTFNNNSPRTKKFDSSMVDSNQHLKFSSVDFNAF